MSLKPIAADLFSTDPGLSLIGGRHRQTGKLSFPLPNHADYERVALPTRGLLWSFTVQRFAPKSPPYRGSLPFTPFAVGYVELQDALIVESRLTDVPFESLRLGMAMQLTTIEVGERSAPVQIFAFRPDTPQGSAR